MITTEEEARRMLGALAIVFQVDPPTLRWTQTQTARYYEKRQRITIGPRCQEIESGLVHEFAHHLSWLRYGRVLHHQAPYWPLLEEVARVYYGDPAHYPWQTEYVIGQRYWRARHGLRQGVRLMRRSGALARG
jgi:hypothetical protein